MWNVGDEQCRRRPAGEQARDSAGLEPRELCPPGVEHLDRLPGGEPAFVERAQLRKGSPLAQDFHQTRAAARDQKDRVTPLAQGRERTLECGTGGQAAFIRHGVRGLQDRDAGEPCEFRTGMAILGDDQHLPEARAQRVVCTKRHRGCRLADREHRAIAMLFAQRHFDAGTTMGRAQRGVEQFEQDATGAHRAQ